MSSIPEFPSHDLTIPARPRPSTTLRPRTLDAATLTFAPSSRWVRAVVGGTPVVDSRHQLLVWEGGSRIPVPEYAFPDAHVRTDLLVPSADAAAAAAYWHPCGRVQWFDLVLPERTVPAAAWKWDDPGLEGYISLTWFPGVIDAWYEEDELVFCHPRDPFKRVDAMESSRHVQVRSAAPRRVLLADSRSAVALFETGLPTRFYVPRGDVCWDNLRPVEMATACPYKGQCDQYWATTADPATPIAWCYKSPTRQVANIKDRVAFYNEKVELVVDGVPFEDDAQTWA